MSLSSPILTVTNPENNYPIRCAALKATSRAFVERASTTSIPLHWSTRVGTDSIPYCCSSSLQSVEPSTILVAPNSSSRTRAKITLDTRVRYRIVSTEKAGKHFVKYLWLIGHLKRRSSNIWIAYLRKDAQSWTERLKLLAQIVSKRRRAPRDTELEKERVWPKLQANGHREDGPLAIRLEQVLYYFLFFSDGVREKSEKKRKI